ncbi:DUF3911 family protein [Ectobacillus sp. sgz5001026]|uniref:DUF3911 family protein n=1 Tax=Ectobacillus sp. sgz5001026 TaxID=3242473 RepID=UPI0036D40AD4
MATIQMKDTPEEVGNVLQIFYFLRSKGLCSFGNCEEHHVEKSEHSELTITSVIWNKEATTSDTEDVRFVSSMLTGVYND